MRDLIRAWNDINVDMCKSINLIGFAREGMTYIKNQQGIKRHYHNRSDYIAQCFKINF